MKERQIAEKMRKIRKTAGTVFLTGAALSAAFAGADNFIFNNSDAIKTTAESSILHADSAEKIAEAKNQTIIFDKRVNERILNGNFSIEVSDITNPQRIQQSIQIVDFEEQKRPILVSNLVNDLSEKKKNRTKSALAAGAILAIFGVLSKLDYYKKKAKA